MSVENKGSGFHFLDTFESCPWKGFLKYVCKLEPTYGNPPMMWGIAIHAGVASFCSTGSPISCESAFIAKMEEQRSLYEDDIKWDEDMARGRKVLDIYCRKYSNELEEYEFLAIEKELQVEFGGFRFNFRLDAVTKSRRTGIVELREIKTSSSLTPDKVFGKVRDQDQITAYMYSWNLLNPSHPIEIAVPDVLYNNRSVFDCQRFTTGIYRSKDEQKQWAQATIQFYTELTQKLKTIHERPGEIDPRILFKRAFSCDGDGFFRCDYKPICRVNFDLNSIPHGYKRREYR